MLDALCNFDAPVWRNITSLRQSQPLFDDLVDDEAGQAAAIAAEMAVRATGPGVIERGLAYSEAVLYPFTADGIAASRYGDGSNRVWYGALDDATAVAETCYHALRQVLGIEGVEQPVVRHRCVYKVDARGLFVDVRGKADTHPELVGDDYAPTQAIGRSLSRQGFGGLLYPAARWPDGECLAAFRADVLSDARVSHYLSYRIDPMRRLVRVERRPGRTWRLLREDDLRRSGSKLDTERR